MSYPLYLAYLLRLWRDSEKDSWRAMLDTAHPGEQVVFATLADLVAYLEYRTGECVCRMEKTEENDQQQDD